MNLDRERWVGVAYAKKDLIIWSCNEENKWRPKEVKVQYIYTYIHTYSKYVCIYVLRKPARETEDLEGNLEACHGWSVEQGSLRNDVMVHPITLSHHVVFNRSSVSEYYLTAVIWVTDLELTSKEHKGVSLWSQTCLGKHLLIPTNDIKEKNNLTV